MERNKQNPTIEDTIEGLKSRIIILEAATDIYAQQILALENKIRQIINGLAEVELKTHRLIEGASPYFNCHPADYASK